MADVETFFNGKTQWVFVKENNEVTITEPTLKELREINPLLLISDCTRTHRLALKTNRLPTKLFGTFASIRWIKPLIISR